jgi:Tfp pilus assembly protein PilX
MKSNDKTMNASGNGSKEGSMIVLVMIILFVTTALASVSLRSAMHTLRMSERQVFMEQAHFAAEAGIEEAARRISSDEYLGAGVTEMTVTLPGGNEAEVTITPLNIEGLEFYVESRATVNGVERVVRVQRMYEPTYLAYSNYWENYGLTWTNGNVVDGNVWTGTAQRIFRRQSSGRQKMGADIPGRE